MWFEELNHVNSKATTADVWAAWRVTPSRSVVPRRGKNSVTMAKIHEHGKRQGSGLKWSKGKMKDSSHCQEVDADVVPPLSSLQHKHPY
jgi:hypothetical protein